jgi:hypothetical protein
MPTPTTLTVESGSGQSAAVNTDFPLPIVARLRDELGNPMAGASVRFTPDTVLANPSGSFAGAPGQAFIDVVTNGVGQATSPILTANGHPGVWVGTIASVAVPAVGTTFSQSNYTIDGPGSGHVVVLANGEQKAAFNSPYLPVSVQVLDQFDTPMPGVTVLMNSPVGHGVFFGGDTDAFATTDALGVATFPALIANYVPGAFAPAIILDLAATFLSFKNIDPAIVVALQPYSGSGQSAPISTLYANKLVVRAANEVNGPVQGVSNIVLTAPGAGASGSWFPGGNPVTLPATDANGLSTAPRFTANATAGTFLITATKAGIPTGYFQLTNGPSVPVDPAGALSVCEV